MTKKKVAGNKLRFIRQEPEHVRENMTNGYNSRMHATHSTQTRLTVKVLNDVSHDDLSKNLAVCFGCPLQ
jgi:hypothetical protein